MEYLIWYQKPGVTEVITRSYLENPESLIQFALLYNTESLIHLSLQEFYLQKNIFKWKKRNRNLLKKRFICWKV